jgi:dipeptidyl aminopeptidase/acylaminoacyl peptidase
LLAVEIDDVKAAVFGAGIYDFQRMYDEVTIPGIRENMKNETGMTPEAVRLRSSVLRMDRLGAPVLILHGEDDKNVPVSQAKLLAKRLGELHKEFDLRLFPGREHSIGPEVSVLTVEFFKKRL